MSKQNKNFQFKGKQVLLLGLVALVITAGYYRWNIEKEALSLAVPTVNEINDDAVSDNVKEEEKKEENSEKSTEEVIKLKQARDSSRSQSVEEWSKIIKDGEASAESKKDAEKKIAAEADYADKERKIETQVKAKGYDDCIAYVTENGVTVTVQGGEVNGEKVAQIKDIIVSTTNVPVRNIKINAI